MSGELVPRKKRRAQVVAVSGGKGGVGKTFFSVNFAVELSKRGYRVLIFDGDINLSNVNILLHINDTPEFKRFLTGEKPVEEIILKGVGGVDVISAGNDIDALLSLNEEMIARISDALSIIEDRYDFIIVDTQAGINEFNINLITNADRAVMITNQEITSLVDLYKVIKVISGRRKGLLYEIVVNRVTMADLAGIVFQKIKNTVQKFNIKSNLKLIGYIFDDPKRVLESIQKQVPFVILHENNPVTECFKIITDNFLAGKIQKRGVSFLSMLLGRG